MKNKNAQDSDKITIDPKLFKLASLSYYMHIMHFPKSFLSHISLGEKPFFSQMLYKLNI